MFFFGLLSELKQSKYAVSQLGQPAVDSFETVSEISLRIIYFDPDPEDFLLKSQIFSPEVCKLRADWPR